MDFKKGQSVGSMREMALATFYYISGSIFGPLLVFLGLGYFLDEALETNRTFLIAGFFIAFVTSNFLLFQKAKKVTKLIESYQSTEKTKGEEKDSADTKN